MSNVGSCVRRAAIAIVATGIVAVPTVHAHPSGKLILVPPTDLPAMARQIGESMLLHGTLGMRASDSAVALRDGGRRCTG
jgi:hypothetical protein